MALFQRTALLLLLIYMLLLIPGLLKILFGVQAQQEEAIFSPFVTTDYTDYTKKISDFWSCVNLVNSRGLLVAIYYWNDYKLY